MTKPRKPVKIPKLESLKQIHLNAAGIDIGSAEHWVAVPEDRDEVSVRSFPAFTPDLHALADWLEACGVDTVAMQSTGVYWIPLFEILEQRGFEVYLVNARATKNVPGRKTDIHESQWIQQLHTYGLLRASFRPEADICQWRTYTRHRDKLTQQRSDQIRAMQKALNLMNLKLDRVISDITGLTGMRIIRAIVDGQREPRYLATFRDPKCKNSTEVIEKSLVGNYKPEHVFELKQALALYDYYTQLIAECDRKIEEVCTRLARKAGPPEKPIPEGKKTKPAKNAPDYDLRSYLYQITGVDLTLIDGVNTLTVQTIVSELGADFTEKFPTFKHFASWLGTCPQNDISGGKVLRTRTKKTDNRVYTALRIAAMSLHHSNCALGAFFRRKNAQLGPAKAITATAHKLARIIYLMLRNKVEYVDLGADYYEKKYKERELRRLRKRAERLGFALVPQEQEQ